VAQTKDPTQGTIELEEDDAPSAIGEIRLNGGDILAQDSVGVFNLRSAGGGIDATTHRALDQLVHAIAETSFEEYIYTGNRVDAIIIWTNSGKTQKVREENFTYTGSKVTSVVTKQYDGAGALVTGETMTETYSYSGNKVADVDRVMS
jgi:hypothetical protein